MYTPGTCHTWLNFPVCPIGCTPSWTLKREQHDYVQSATAPEGLALQSHVQGSPPNTLTYPIQLVWLKLLSQIILFECKPYCTCTLSKAVTTLSMTNYILWKKFETYRSQVQGSPVQMSLKGITKWPVWVRHSKIKHQINQNWKSVLHPQWPYPRLETTVSVEQTSISPVMLHVNCKVILSKSHWQSIHGFFLNMNNVNELRNFAKR